MAASQAELERLKGSGTVQNTVLELYRQHIASLTNVPGEETLKPLQKLETKQPAAEQKPAAPKADKSSRASPGPKGRRGQHICRAGADVRL